MASTIVASIVVSIVYVLVSGLFDFGVRWELKGRKDRGEYRIWTNEKDDGRWRLETGDLGKLVSIHDSRRQINYVERSVRFKEGNPYALGLSLATGAVAIDVSAIIGGGSAPINLAYAVVFHGVILLMIAMLIVWNQNSDPNEVARTRFTAGISIFLGLIAMVISFLLVIGGG